MAEPLAGRADDRDAVELQQRFLVTERAHADRRLGKLPDLAHCLTQRAGSEPGKAREVKGSYEYWVESRDAGSVFFRQNMQTGSLPQSILDTELLAETTGGLVCIGEVKVSPCEDLLAFILESGRQEGGGRIKHLQGGVCRPEIQIPGAVSLEWASDGRTVIFTLADKTNRPCQVLMLDIFSHEQAKEIYIENDARFFVQLTQTKDHNLLLVNSNSKTSSEVHVLDAGRPWESQLTCVQPRQEGLEYFVEHHEGWLYILTNQGQPGQEYCLCIVPLARPYCRNWQIVVGERADIAMEDLDMFARGCVLHLRSRGQQQLSLLPHSSLATSFPDSDGLTQQGEPIAVEAGANADYAATTFRVTTSSLTRPHKQLDLDLCNDTSTSLGTQIPMLAAEQPSAQCTTLWATAVDGVQIPMTVAFPPRRAKQPCSTPALVYAYGAYGQCLDISHAPEYGLLLDHGFIIAFAHVRGDGTLGRRWHTEGSGIHKECSISDLISCVEHLIATGLTTTGRIGLHVTSAGGVLLGNLLNRRPELLGAAVARSPFLDLLHTMANPDAHLTVHEYAEWGNPSTSSQTHDQVKRICPYANLKQPITVPLLISASLDDDRVPFSGTLKWLRRLRLLGRGNEDVALNCQEEGRDLLVSISFLARSKRLDTLDLQLGPRLDMPKKASKGVPPAESKEETLKRICKTCKDIWRFEQQPVDAKLAPGPFVNRDELHLLRLPKHKSKFPAGFQEALSQRGGTSKSCHACQEQHVVLPCQIELCKVSICYRCTVGMAGHIANAEEDKVERFNQGICARCLGLCNCKECMRAGIEATLPPCTAPQQREYAMRLLTSCAPQLQSVLKEEDEAVRAAGFKGGLAEVPERTIPDDRILCNGCGTSLSHLHWACPLAAEPQVTCKKHGTPLQPFRFVDAGRLPDFLEAIEFVRSQWPSISLAPGGLDGKAGADKDSATAAQAESTGQDAKSSKHASKAQPCPVGKAISSYLYQWRLQDNMGLGVPTLVRNVKATFDWSPSCLMRATRDQRTVKTASKPGSSSGGHGSASVDEKADRVKERICDRLQVIQCDKWATKDMPQKQFFDVYQGWNPDTPGENLKVKDFPPQGLFQRVMPRHNKDFMRQLPFAELTHLHGPLNLHAHYPEGSIKPDLGPKSYIATGRPEEGKGGDSVTRLHVDLSDAVNITLHVQRGPQEAPTTVRCGSQAADAKKDPRWGGAGSVWSIWARSDVPVLQAWLRKNKRLFTYAGRGMTTFELFEPICHQVFMLTAAHLEKLKADTGVEPWTFEQHEGEAVIIPAGCPHQVRNLRPATKVAVDFVAPDSMPVAFRLRQVRAGVARREIADNARCGIFEPTHELEFQDVLQVPSMVQRTICWALDVLQDSQAAQHAASLHPAKPTEKPQAPDQKPEGGGEAASIQQPALEPAALNEATNWPRHNQAAAVSHCIVSQAAPSGCPPPAAAGNGDFTAHLPGLDPAPKPAKSQGGQPQQGPAVAAAELPQGQLLPMPTRSAAKAMLESLSSGLPAGVGTTVDQSLVAHFQDLVANCARATAASKETAQKISSEAERAQARVERSIGMGQRSIGHEPIYLLLLLILASDPAWVQREDACIQGGPDGILPQPAI
ncbi:hypothetical protein WJX84_007913 [Apatococcus fuscideae]|uniref:Prolyl endopeptidase-like n=1 Tax=Apatococcus fuscideae TaxID=2026836 RepID=A0AAW1T4G8_9CHLO